MVAEVRPPPAMQRPPDLVEIVDESRSAKRSLLQLQEEKAFSESYDSEVDCQSYDEEEEKEIFINDSHLYKSSSEQELIDESEEED